MVVFDSLKAIYNILLAPFISLFGAFPAFTSALGLLLFLTLSYFGWRAIK